MQRIPEHNCAVICWIVVTILQVAIVEAHRKAVSNGHFTYDDPITGLKVSI